MFKQRALAVLAAIGLVIASLIITANPAAAAQIDSYSADCTGVSGTFSDFPGPINTITIGSSEGILRMKTFPGTSGNVTATWTELGVFTPLGGTHTYGFSWTADGGGSTGPITFDASSCAPQPAAPTVTASSPTCVNAGETTGVVNGSVTNTNDDTDDSVTYTVSVAGVDSTSVPDVADGASGAFVLDGFAPGSYTVNVSGDDGTAASTSVTVTQCAPPVPADPTATASAAACVDAGGSDGVVNGTVTNTNDDTDDSVTYTVSVSGVGDATVADVADGASGNWSLSGFAPGTYTVNVSGDDGTSVSVAVEVEECAVTPTTPPPTTVPPPTIPPPTVPPTVPPSTGGNTTAPPAQPVPVTPHFTG